MNGMNKAIIGIVLGIALVYSIGSFVLTAIEIWNTGNITIVMFMPHLKDGAFVLDYKLGELSGIALGYYDRFIDYILDDLIKVGGDSRKFIVLAVVAAGFVMAVIGFFMKPTLDVKGRTNPAEYLWTHRPEAFARAILAPWGFLAGMWAIKKPFVIVPIVLLPLYAWWSLIMTVLIIIPFAIVKAVVSAKIAKASKREAREYGKATQYAVCPVCKRNFRRPNIKCQKCDLVLDYPVPNIYGYKYHTCNKGHKIPCQSGMRAGLRTVCPHCNADIQTREAKPIAVAMVGACGSGKTTMMLAMVKTVSASGRARDISVDASTPGIAKTIVEAKDYAPPTSSGELDSECMFIRSNSLSDREVLINDISGHEFEAKQGKTLFEEYFTYADGIVFAFDPISLGRGRGQTPMEVFESFHYMFTQINQVSPSHVSKVPFAVVATHADVSKLKDGDVRQFLQDNGQEGFVRVLESLFTTVSYYSVCSAGENCSSAAKPFWWIAGLVDKELVQAVPVERRVRASIYDLLDGSPSKRRNALSAQKKGFADQREMRLIAAVAILAIAIAGCSLTFTGEESDAEGEKWSVASKAGAIANGSINPEDTESTALEHTITIKSATGYFVPLKNATSNNEVQLDGEQAGVTGAQVVAGSYTPNADRTSATVKVKVTTITADHAKVYIKCTCVKAATISFTSNITGPPAVTQLKVAPGSDYKVTLTNDKVAYTGYDIKTAKLTKGTDTQSVNVTTNADKSITFTIPAKYLVANTTMTAQLNYTLHVYSVTAGSLYNLTLDIKGTREYNTEVVITIKGTTGYHAPAKTTGIEVKGGSVYSYSYAGEGNDIIGTVTIPKITTDVTINGAADGNTYKVTYMADALDVGKVPVKFSPEFHTYTYGSALNLPTEASQQVNHLELTFIECIDANGQKITVIPASEKHLEDFTVSIKVEDNMDYADYTPRNITIILCIVAAAVLALVMVVIKR